MIREGKDEGWLDSPISLVPSYSDFNGILFNGTHVSQLENRGSAVVATRSLNSRSGPLLAVSKELILSQDNVELHAHSDKYLREVLDALGDFGKVKIPVHYMKFLPLELLPTFWTDAEKDLLRGTSLAPATDAKLKRLHREFAQLRLATNQIEWCQKCWWHDADGLLVFDDWKQVDAMYRSRALEFPKIGDAMVPMVDMANHCSGEGTAALYEDDEDGNAVLLLRDRVTLRDGEEVTISYGDEKGACEMIHSYGFIEENMKSARDVYLDLQIPDDDPLKRPKQATATCAPGVRIFDIGDWIKWESDFVYLICVNEEDGLIFRIEQTNDGDQQLKITWNEEELTDTESLRGRLQDHPSWDLFLLRAITIIHQRVKEQLLALHNLVDGASAKGQRHGMEMVIREAPKKLAGKLSTLEMDLLEKAHQYFEAEKVRLTQESPIVQGYLARQAEDDFS
ncbi:MAG: hypothetical protein M1831_007057 [Alyxoria varia]|nr:MAG: hypothetical protein M1831_007057 [Alyxoria varia]